MVGPARSLRCHAIEKRHLYFHNWLYGGAAFHSGTLLWAPNGTELSCTGVCGVSGLEPGEQGGFCFEPLNMVDTKVDFFYFAQCEINTKLKFISVISWNFVKINSKKIVAKFRRKQFGQDYR
jgi:hypothetical protein